MAESEIENIKEKKEDLSVVNTQSQWVKFDVLQDNRIGVDSLPVPPFLSKDLSSEEYLLKLGKSCDLCQYKRC